MNISDTVFAVVDVETTGLDPAVDRLVEIACVATTADRAVAMFSTLVNPGIPIPPEVSAVHGLADADVVNAPSPTTALRELREFLLHFDPVLAAHHLEFDAAFLGLTGQGLCTKRLAMHLWPHFPAHKNQTLRFRRQLQVETFGIAPHRALGDALVTAALLRDELASEEFAAASIDTVDALIEFAERDIIFEKIPFGKHRGSLIASLPLSYVSWCLREMKDLSRDMRATLVQRMQGAA